MSFAADDIYTYYTFVLVVSLLGIIPVSIIAFRSISPDLSKGNAGGFASAVRIGVPIDGERPYTNTIEIQLTS